MNDELIAKLNEYGFTMIERDTFEIRDDPDHIRSLWINKDGTIGMYPCVLDKNLYDILGLYFK